MNSEGGGGWEYVFPVFTPLSICTPGTSGIHCGSHSGTGDILGAEWGEFEK